MKLVAPPDTPSTPCAGEAQASQGSTADYWRDYYDQLQSTAASWLDCSNERTHLQTIALALEAAGQVVGRRTLELGCGRGHLSRCLSVLEASERVAVDQVAALLAGYNQQYPDVAWHCADANDHNQLSSLGKFDLIFLLEVLQYLPISATLNFIAERLTPGGRLVAIVPNAACPIVKKVVPRFEGKYVPADIAVIKRTLEAAPLIDWWACRGLTFADDQRVAPYAASPWSSDPQWSQPPNRLLFVAQAKAA